MSHAGLRDLLLRSDAIGLSHLLSSKQVRPVELVDAAIELIEMHNRSVNAVIHPMYESARELALSTQLQGDFAGVPFLAKNMGSSWKGTRYDAGLAFLSDFRSDHDSTVTTRIKQAGFIPIGKTNVPEFGWSLGNESSMYGDTINPWNHQVTPGGSSGGAAVAVASGFVPIAEASDGGGSIRVPASCCGLVGLKPSRGRVPTGPKVVDKWFGCSYTNCVSRSVRDSAAFLDVIAGSECGDLYSAKAERTTWLLGHQDRTRKLRIGRASKVPWGPSIANEVQKAVDDIAQVLSSRGHMIETFDLALDFQGPWRAYNDVIAVETAVSLQRLASDAEVPLNLEQLQPFNRTQVSRGQSLQAVELSHAIATIKQFGKAICVALSPFDAYLTPTLTQCPRPRGYWSLEESDYDRYLDKWSDATFMFPFNLSGQPAISVPAPTSCNFPIGVQLVSACGDEMTLLRLASEIEEDAPWKNRFPCTFLQDTQVPSKRRSHIDPEEGMPTALGLRQW